MAAAWPVEGVSLRRPGGQAGAARASGVLAGGGGAAAYGERGHVCARAHGLLFRHVGTGMGTTTEVLMSARPSLRRQSAAAYSTHRETTQRDDEARPRADDGPLGRLCGPATRPCCAVRRI